MYQGRFWGSQATAITKISLKEPNVVLFLCVEQLSHRGNIIHTWSCTLQQFRAWSQWNTARHTKYYIAYIRKYSQNRFTAQQIRH